MDSTPSQQQINLELSLDDVNAIMHYLGELPTKAMVYPLVMKIKSQAEQQLPSKE